LDDAQEQMRNAYHKQWNAYQDAGGVYDQDEVSDIFMIANDTLISYCSDPTAPHNAWKKITDVELALDDYGPCRLDLVGDNKDNWPTIADVKYKRELKPFFLEKTQRQFQGDWGLTHYKSVLPLARPFGPQAYLTSILLIVARPKYALHEWLIPTLSVRDFESSAVKKYERMKHQSALPILDMEMPSVHEDQFGLCPFIPTCFNYGRDPKLDKGKFIPVKWPRFEEEPA
jgi:hypothetical protein